MEELNPSASDPRAWFAIVRRRWPIILGCAVVVTALLVGLAATQKKQYEAKATLLLGDLARQSASNAIASQRGLNNELVVANSGEVRAAARKVYEGPLDVESVTVEATDTAADAVVVRARGRNPDEIAKLVNTYAQAFIDYRQSQKISVLTSAANELSTRIADLDAQIAQLNSQVDELDARIAFSTEPERSALSAQRADLVASVARQSAPLLSQVSFYRTQLGQNQTDQALLADNVTVVDHATPPTSAVSPNPVRNGIGGLALGLLLGAAIAALLERLDDRVRDQDTLERAVRGRPVLAAIPPSGRGASGLVTIKDPTSAAAEAFRQLRTAIRFASIESPASVVAVASATEGEGVSEVVANLGVVVAQSGLRVAVVSGDLRKPSLHTLFGLDSSPGLTSVLLEDAPLVEALRPVPGVPGLDLLASGALPPNPSELLDSTRVGAVFKALADSYDMVLLDTPPLLDVTDALIVGRCADAVAVVARVGRVDRSQLVRALDHLAQANLPVMGIVAHDVERS
jgi:capsular exopolysaccharide synthesis family protein